MHQLTQFMQSGVRGKLDESERDAADRRLGQVVDPGDGWAPGVHLLQHFLQLLIVVVLELKVVVGRHGSRQHREGRVGRHQQHAQRWTHLGHSGRLLLTDTATKEIYRFDLRY